MMMKKIFSTLTIFITLISCQDLEEMNINPNQPTETHPQLLLTNVEWDAFQSYKGGSALYAIKMIIQTDGENVNQLYKWDRGSYGDYGTLRDVTKMMEEGERVGDLTYVALGKFFRSYYFYHLTMTFGAIPYSAALNGESSAQFTPAYDDQKAVFEGILDELREANEILAESNTIIAGDIIYGGDVLSWRKLINAFRLKVMLTLSGKTDEIDLSGFASIFQNEPLMEGVEDNAQLVFLDQQGNRYPDFNNSGFGSGLYMDSTFIRRLQDREDPRLFIYASQSKSAREAGKPVDDFTGYEGGDPAAPYAEVNATGLSKPNERYYKDPVNEPYVLLGYPEQQFILAEAAVRGWISADAEALYTSGVKGSFAFYEAYAEAYSDYVTEADADAYLSKPVNDFSQAADDNAKIELIVTQKYLQSFYQSGWTSFFDHLRTGYPSFRRPAGVEVPYRWIYPQSEYNYNTDNVAAAIRSQFGEGNDKIDEMTWWLE